MADTQPSRNGVFDITHSGFRCFACDISTTPLRELRTRKTHAATAKHKRAMLAWKPNRVPNDPPNTPDASLTTFETHLNQGLFSLDDDEDPLVRLRAVRELEKARQRVHVTLEDKDDAFDSVFDNTPDYFEADGSRAIFEAGPSLYAPLERQRPQNDITRLLQEKFDTFNLQHLTNEGGEVNGVSVFEGVAEAMRRAADYVVTPSDRMTFTTDGGWAPYRNKSEALTDILLNAPHLHFSEPQIKAILKWASEMGAKDVPTLYRMKQVSRTLLEAVGNPVLKKKTADGHFYYLNQISESVAQDFSNPQTSPHLSFYPIDSGGRASQVWNGHKLLYDLPDHILTPMYALSPTRHFYVNELVQLSDNSYFIPLRWFLKRDGMWMVGHNTNLGSTGELSVGNHRVERSTAELMLNYPELIANGECPALSNENWKAEMPHRLREKAAGRPFYSVPIMVFMDDMSGNVSKQWNKHWSVYTSNAALPREILNQQYHIKFASTTPNAEAMDVMKGVIECMKDSFDGDGSEVWYSALQCEALARIYPLVFPADNPMQAEEASGGSLNSTCNCRFCHLGGTKEQKVSDDGYLGTFRPGIMRKVDETIDTIFLEYVISMEESAKSRLNNTIRDTGVKDSIALPIMYKMHDLGAVLRTRATGAPKPPEASVTSALEDELMKRKGSVINPLLFPGCTLGVDVHRDTPVEILHTILLGIIKYFWAQTVTRLEKDGKLNELQARLASIDESGLAIPSLMPEYFVQYKGALIGKHFKSLVQIMSFAVQGMVNRDVCNAWSALGRLTVLLWHTEIVDIVGYKVELQEAIDDVLSVSAKCSPSILITKSKLHFLVHLPENIERFGPAILFATERYESFNSVVRGALIYSNRQAPSRDAAYTFAGFERVKHIFAGGKWRDKDTMQWIQAGPKTVQYVHQSTLFSHLLNLPDELKDKQGNAVLAIKKDVQTGADKSIYISWKDTVASHTMSTPHNEPDTRFALCHSVIAANRDKVLVNSHVIVQGEAGRCAFGRVSEILKTAKNENGGTYITIQIQQLLDELHPQYRMPVLQSISGDYRIVSYNEIIAVINTQHDCVTFNCQANGIEAVVEERLQTQRTRAIIKHLDNTQFIINTHSLHNYQHISSALPPSLRRPPLLVIDHDALRLEAAAEVRGSKYTKDAAAKEKREAKKKEEGAMERKRRHDGVAEVADETDNQPPKKKKKKELTSEELAQVAAAKEQAKEQAACEQREEQLARARALRLRLLGF